jgi:hypothetical protein
LFEAAKTGEPIRVVASSAITIFLILLSPSFVLEAAIASALLSTLATRCCCRNLHRWRMNSR